MMNGWSGKILNIYNFTVLSSIESDIIFDCYIAFCNNLCCIFPSMSEENKSIMSSNRSLWKAKDIFCSAFFILCFILTRGFKTSWKVPTLKAAFCFAHLTYKNKKDRKKKRKFKWKPIKATAVKRAFKKKLLPFPLDKGDTFNCEERNTLIKLFLLLNCF